MTHQTYVFDPLSPEFQRDRHVVLKYMRESYPVYSEPDQTLSGRKFIRWTFTKYEDVLMVLRDPKFVKEIRRILPEEAVPPVPEAFRVLAESQSNIMLFRDPPDHTRLRTLVNKAFTPRIVNQLVPRIQDIAQYLLVPCEPGESFDAVRNFAYALPVIVIAELLGVPSEERDQFKAWSNLFIKTIDYKPTLETLIEGNQMTIDFRSYFRELVRQRAKNPKDDLISELVQVRDEQGARLSEEELLDMCILILIAGHETTVNLIGNMLFLLATHGDQQALLRAKPELMESAIEEVLRFESPVQVTGRFTSEDFELRGQHIQKGDFINVWMGSANRDPDVFTDPDVFDITRTNNRHLSFGQGIHFCLGAPLARKEGAIAIETFLRKYPTLRLATEEVTWAPSPLMRSLKELEVSV